MRQVLVNVPNDDSFVNETWEDHMTSLCQVLGRIRVAKLTSIPSKYMIGYGIIECLGHNIVDQTVRPQEDKIQAIRSASWPPKSDK